MTSLSTLGAFDTVMPRKMLEHVALEPSEMSRQGLEYEAANGGALPNLGQRRLDCMTPGSNFAKDITFQVADVHKPLLSVSKLADINYVCRVDTEGGWLEDRERGEWIPVRREGSLYVLKMWVRARSEGGQGFARPGAQP